MSKVLVVEDSPAQRSMVATILAANGRVIQSAKDGIEALKLIKQWKPDVVILDVIMPGMNGFEVCRRIKNDQEMKLVSVIMCTSMDAQSERYWGMKQGADVYLSKPFKPHELVEIVQQLENN